VQEIIKKSGANVQVPKAEENTQPLDEDDDLTIDVAIEGDPIAAEIARREIEAIVKERTSTMSTRLREIPAELYPFLAGPFNSAVESFNQGGDVQVKIPAYQTWSRQATPSFDEQSQRPRFAPHPTSHIQLSGDRDAVQRTRAEIERQVNTLREQIAMKQLQIDKNRHQFIIEDPDSLHSFLEKNGCYVLLPPDSDETDLVTLVGPENKLAQGEADVVDLAMKMQSQLIDVARLHNKAPQGAQQHARALTNYLRQRRAIAEIEKLHNSRIVLPSADEPVNWEVYSSDGPASYKAKSDITNIINAHPPSRFRHIPVDPFYHQHIRDHYRNQLQQDFGVHLIVPDETQEEPQLIIVYEGQPQSGSYDIPRQRPSPSEVTQFEEALRKAQQLIQGLANGQKPIETRSVDVPAKFHDKAQKYVRTEQRSLPEGSLPVQFLSRSPDQSGSSIRGPSDRLDDLAKKIRAFVESEKQDELERGHVISFDFPKKHANFLIGKRGENINKLREEFDVDIQVNDGKVDIKGPPKKAEAAKSRILALSKKLEDETTHTLKVHPQYHRELIGARGSQVNRLQDRYNVRIQFPRSASNHDDDASVANGSEIGGPKTPRTNQASDEVIIRGPKKGADAAKEELESLLKYTVDNSQTATVSVSQSQLPSLIGTGGREMENIRQSTGAKIDVPGSKDTANENGRVELKIKGTKKQVEDAKKLLEERAKIFDDSTTKTIQVDKKHHRAIIGPQGKSKTLIPVLF
jgi:transcription antitermination factor NusA-like protein